MTFKKSIYISGPRMGQNNSMYGIDASTIKNKSAKRVKSKKTSRKKNK